MDLKDKEQGTIVKELSKKIKIDIKDLEKRITIVKGMITQLNLNDLDLKVVPDEILKLATITNLEIAGNNLESITVLAALENLHDNNLSRKKEKSPRSLI